MTKPEVRELARRFSLEVADKQDSQDICFVPSGRYTDIIGRLRPNAMLSGDIVDLDGRVLGAHQGIANFTVGQRKGLGIAASAPALCRAARCGKPPRRGRPARGAAHGPHRAARRQLDRRRRARSRDRRGHRDVRARALDPARRSRPGCAPAATVTRSNWSRARRAFRPDKPVYFMMRPRGRRACSAAALSGARRRRWSARESGSAARGSSDEKLQGRGWGTSILPA